MRIALLAYRGSMKSGGLGIYLRDLTRELARLGHEMDLFVGPPYPDPLPWLTTIRIHNEQYWDRLFTASWRAPLPQHDPFRAFSPLNFFELAATRFGFLPEPFSFSVRAARMIHARMRAGLRYDLIHDVQTLGYGLLWLRALGLPTVSTIHHPLTIDRRFSLRRDRTFKERKGTLTFYPVRTQARVARRIDALITSSEASIHELQVGFGVSRRRIHNVANGVELPPQHPKRARRARPVLLFLGRTRDPNKGLEHLLEAMALLSADVTLRVLDDHPTPGEIRLHALIADLKLHERVRFEGKLPRPQLETVLGEVDIVVVPSLFEGFGLPAVEALAAGTPVVASSAGALPEVVALAGTGTLVPPGDPRALAAGIEATLAHWDREHETALASRQRIERAFSWSQVAIRTAAVYDTVLQARHAARND